MTTLASGGSLGVFGRESHGRGKEEAALRGTCFYFHEVLEGEEQFYYGLD